MLSLLPFIAANFVVALSGAAFPPDDWFKHLAKPSWQPPNWLFAPAWTVLYVCIAISGWFAWRQVGLTGAPLATAAYAIQLILNAAWSAIFFGLRRIGWAFVEVVLLWLAIVATIALFTPLSTTATVLLMPYLAWVTFAGVLNLAVWRLNQVHLQASEVRH